MTGFEHCENSPDFVPDITSYIRFYYMALVSLVRFS